MVVDDLVNYGHVACWAENKLQECKYTKAYELCCNKCIFNLLSTIYFHLISLTEYTHITVGNKTRTFKITTNKRCKNVEKTFSPILKKKKTTIKTILPKNNISVFFNEN